MWTWVSSNLNIKQVGIWRFQHGVHGCTSHLMMMMFIIEIKILVPIQFVTVQILLGFLSSGFLSNGLVYPPDGGCHYRGSLHQGSIVVCMGTESLILIVCWWWVESLVNDYSSSSMFDKMVNCEIFSMSPVLKSKRLSVWVDYVVIFMNFG